MDVFLERVGKPLAERRLENNLERERAARHIAARGGASVAELMEAMSLPSGHVHALLRTMRAQGLIAKRDTDGRWVLTGIQAERRPRRVNPNNAKADGQPRIKYAAAVQIGIVRDPLVAALFGPCA